ncbi:MAG TPA: hypothetical protein VF266_21300 [Thermoanaerobaculia bacterium]
MKQAALGLVLAVSYAFGAAGQSYDYVLAGPDESACRFAAILDPAHRINWIVGGARAHGGPEVNAVAAAPGGRVVAAIPTGDTFHVDYVTADGSSQRIGIAPPGYTPLSLVAGANGTVYALAVENASPARVIVVFAPDGTVTAQPLPTSIANAFNMDLAADQCTLFLVAAAGIARYNVCTQTELPLFATGITGVAVRILPDGGAVVARGGNLAPVRLSPAGLPAQTYTLPEPEAVRALAIADGGSRVIAATRCTESIYSIDVATGQATRVAYGLYSLELPRFIVPYLSWTAALGASHTPTVPTAGELALALLATGLAGAALLRMR